MLTETPPIYEPKFDIESQTYTDQYVYDITKGITCPCLQFKVFTKRESFTNHWKSIRHKKWLTYMSENNTNYYAKCMEQEKTIRNQQMLLTQYQDELSRKNTIIHYLEAKPAWTLPPAPSFLTGLFSDGSSQKTQLETAFIDDIC